MNPVFLRRLVGLVVLMAVFFGLSWLLGEPAKRRHAGEQRVMLGVTPHVEVPEPATSATPITPATPAPELAPAHSPPSVTAAGHAPAASNTAAAPSAIDERLSHPQEADSTESPEVAVAPAAPPEPLHRPHLKSATHLSHGAGAGASPTKTAPSPAELAKATPPPTVYTLPPPSPPVHAPAMPPPGGGHGAAWVQVGSFSQQQNAGTVLAVLQHSGFHGEVTETRSGANRMFRVRLGPYASAADAAAVRQRLSGQGYPSARVVDGP